MKPNQKLLEAELKRTRQLMEDISIVNKGVLDKAGHWNVPHIVNVKKGLAAYEKNNYNLTPLGKPNERKLDVVTGPGDMRLGNKSYKFKDAIYMLPEQADELNVLGQQIRQLIAEYNEKYNQYVKE